MIPDHTFLLANPNAGFTDHDSVCGATKVVTVVVLIPGGSR